MFDKERIIESYIEFYQSNGKFPEDAEEFSRYLGLPESEFLRSFNPLSSLESYIWEKYFDRALEASQKDPAFDTYASREIYLSLLYNLIQVLNEDAQMNKDMISFRKSLPSFPKELKLLKKSADDFFAQMIGAGMETGEIASRSLVEYQYKRWCWGGLLFVIFFWQKDSSENGESTDVAIEKMAHLIFDMLNPNALDSSIEFFSFLFKQGFR